MVNRDLLGQRNRVATPVFCSSCERFNDRGFRHPLKSRDDSVGDARLVVFLSRPDNPISARSRASWVGVVTDDFSEQTKSVQLRSRASASRFRASKWREIAKIASADVLFV